MNQFDGLPRSSLSFSLLFRPVDSSPFQVADLTEEFLEC